MVICAEYYYGEMPRLFPCSSATRHARLISLLYADYSGGASSRALSTPGRGAAATLRSTPAHDKTKACQAEMRQHRR